jgi:hypothetical protein
MAAAGFVAQSSLHDHVRAVVKALEKGRGWKRAARPYR